MVLFRSEYKVSFLYAAVFMALGAHLPFWPLWLADWGLSPTKIGFFASMAIFARVPIGILGPYLGDIIGNQRLMLLILSFCMAVIFGLHVIIDIELGLFIASLVVAGLFAAIIPVTEAIGQRTAEQDGFSYGRTRSWGSIGFLATNIICGLMIFEYGVSVILWWIVSCALFLAIMAYLLPKPIERKKSLPSFVTVKNYLSKAWFVMFLTGGALIQASHAVYYTYGSLHWRGLGYDESTIGGLWAIGVLAEIILFFYVATRLNRISAKALIIIGGLGAVIRWGITAFDPSLIIIATVQTLHAASFAITHLGMILFIKQNIPENLRSTFIGIFGSGFVGILMTIGILIAAWSYSVYEGGAYLSAAIMALFGVLLLIPINSNSADT